MIIRNSSEIYLDSNATTPVLPAAAQAAREAMEQIYGNPSSSHVSGLKARDILETARDLCRQVLGATDGQIVFTSGATEAIQMGVFSTLCDIREQRIQDVAAGNEPRLLLYAATEHKAVPQAIHHWNKLLGINDRVVEIPVDPSGQIDIEFIREHAPNADLVCTMAVNNETGVIAQLDKIEAAIRETNREAKWLVDCVQSIGKMKIDLSSTSIDYATLSGHKIYAPKGIGVLYVREGAPLVPLLAGGGQEQGARGGTENLPGVAAIAAVLEELCASEDLAFAPKNRLIDFNQRIKSALQESFPGIVFNSPSDWCVPTTINFSIEGFLNKELLDLFDAAGIRVSSGSACSSKVVGSFVLDAMGLPRWRSEGAIRLSFGPLTSESEIDAACERIRDAGKALCNSCLLLNEQYEESSEPVDGLVQLKNGSNCTWVLMDSETKRCLVVDPFDEMSSRVEALVRCQESSVVAILDSHAHVDHDSCRGQLMESVDSRILPTAKTNDPLGWPDSVDGTIQLADGTQAPYIKFSSRWIVAQCELAGHTKIGRAYLVGSPNQDGALLPENIEFVFSGDMILMGGIGRTDFPCSDIEAMYDSLNRLSRIIGPRTAICPTHDYNNELATTLTTERARNEFLNSILCENAPLSKQEYLQQKPTIDAGISDETNPELVCGLIGSVDCQQSAVEIPRSELKEFFKTRSGSLIIDVREPHEFIFAQDWSELGFHEPPQNIPLTRLIGCLPAICRQHQESPRDIIFLCRSGRRSGVAASVTRAFGIESARHVAGGIALNVATKCVAEEWAEPGYMI